MPSETLTITDNRTGKTYELPITHETIKATDLRQMKTDPELRLIPVVMLTSSREESDLAASYKLGANAYVVKPVDFQAFLDTVKYLGIFWARVNEAPACCARKPI